MSENLQLAQECLNDLTAATDPHLRQIAAIRLATMVLNDLEGHGAYSVLATLVTGFIIAQEDQPLTMMLLTQTIINCWRQYQEAISAPEAEKPAIEEPEEPAKKSKRAKGPTNATFH
jgi:hypothetical protein